MKFGYAVALCGGVALASLASTPASAATSCESLAQFHEPNVTITVAAMADNPASEMAPVRSDGNPALATATPAPVAAPKPLCRVAGFISPTGDSRIGFELWLPPAGTWNRKLQAVGNGGLSGAINQRAMLPGFNRGYATMTTDLGHTNTPPGSTEDAKWALGHPEKIIDYAYRGEHLTTLAAKQIVKAYYDAAPAHSFYTGCSAGGIQGINELIRYPMDFDGYVIGNATPDHLGQEVAALWNTLHGSLLDEADALKPATMTLVHAAVLKQCAGKDGGLATDPFLTNPMACKFQPKSLACKPGQDAASCLNPAQVAILDKIYQGPTNPRTWQSILAGLTPGTELGWDRYFTGKKNPAGLDRPWSGFFVSMVYSDPTWLSEQRYLKFDFDKDVAAARALMVGGETLDSSWNVRSRDLDAFKEAGGKVLQYHGWDDPNIPALEAVRLFEGVVADQAKRHKLTPAQARELTQRFYRLFMVPGMGHCGGGDGPSAFGQNQQGAGPETDTLKALERWVEQGVAPERFIASRTDEKTKAVDMTRPICVFPKIPVWKGAGSTTDATNFICSAAPKS